MQITIRVMGGLEKGESIKKGNTVTLNERGVIEITVHGPQTRHTMQQVHDELRSLINILISQGKKVHVLTDISAMNGVKTDSGSRQETRAMLADLSIDRSAIYGSGPGVSFAMFLSRFIGLGGHIKLFRNRRKAELWLSGHDNKISPHATAGLIGSVVIVAVAMLALVGWQIDNAYLMGWSPYMRPVNPVAAVGIIIIGCGLISYWMHRIIGLRFAGALSVILGAGALISPEVSTILYGPSVISGGITSQIAYSAAWCFILLGTAALITQQKYINAAWLWIVEIAFITIVIGVSLINVFAHLYNRTWLYENVPHYPMAINLSFSFAILAAILLLISLYKKKNINVISHISRVGWLVVLVLLCAQVATYVAWSQAESHNRLEAATVFTKNASDIEDTLRDRFESYINALYGFQGLFRASESINEAEFQTYYNTTNTAQHYPGLRALSFVSKVSESEIPAFLKQRRTDKSLKSTGEPNFEIRQKSKLNDHYVLTYIVNSTNIPGTDLGSDPERLAAFREAAVTKKPVATGTIVFAATATQRSQEGFFITVPVSYAGNPNKIIGYVNAVFNYKGFFVDTFDEKVLADGLNVTLTDTLDNSTVFSTGNTGATSSIHTYTTLIDVANRKWKLNITAPESFATTESSLPLAIIIGGQAFSILLLFIIINQARARQRALNLANRITKDLQYERNLAVSNSLKNTAILESIGDGVFAVDTRGRITVFNPAAERISGVLESEAMGRHYAEVLHFEYEKTGKMNDVFIKKALRGHLASMANHTVIIRPDGTRIPVADSAAPIRDVANDIIGAIVVFRDVSTEHQLDKAKSEFVSLASHQLRTPLSAINWYGEMLLNGDAGKLNKDQHMYIREIFEGSQRMVELVNSLLDVSRIEIGRLINKPEPTNVTDVVNSIRKELEVSIKAKKLTVHANVLKIPDVTADPKQLRMIVQNLISNAVKYTDEKNSITITLRKATPADMSKAKLKSDEAHWFFSVEDNGYGIPDDQQAKIFSKLFRADNVRKLDVEGTGLGLYIVKEVVDKMGGKVWFDSKEGKGSTFFVVAPINVRYHRNDV